MNAYFTVYLFWDFRHDPRYRADIRAAVKQARADRAAKPRWTKRRVDKPCLCGYKYVCNECRKREAA